MPTALKAAVIAAVCLLSFAPLAAAQESQPDARGELIQFLDHKADADEAQRAALVARIRNRAAAERRQAWVRAEVLQLIGGLPEQRGPLQAREMGTVSGDGFRVVKVIYDSLPDFHVTANLYLPTKGSGPFPAILYTPGHGPGGKAEAWVLAGNLARNGIAVLAWDPIGQGERLQYLDPATGTSLAGAPTSEHSEASLQTMPVGDQISRYFVWDGMRGIDYLTSRHDIDAHRIGVFGCSGGGTDTAYLAALDPRVKVAGIACYITSFDALLATLGPQDAEQSIPNFISAGLGFPDWVERFAPKPFAIISTTEDMFPFAGARQSYQEAKGFYSLFGAQDHLQWITGPGHHGHLQPIYPQIIGFFTHWLANSTAAPTVVPLTAPPAKELDCTRSGQVGTSPGGATIWSLNKKRAEQILPRAKAVTTPAEVVALRRELQRQIRALAHVSTAPGGSVPAVRVRETEQRSGYELRSVIFPSITGVELPGYLAAPRSGSSGTKAARHPGVLLLTDEPWDTVAQTGGLLDQLASSGKVVFAPAPLPTPPGREEMKSPVLGDYYLLSLRTMLVGETLPGLRIDDALRAMNWLAAQPNVDATRIAGDAEGSMGLVMLQAAVLDDGIRSLTLRDTLVSYRSIVNQPLPRNIAQDEIPGVLRRYDTGNLLLAVSPRPVTVIRPVDAEGHAVGSQEFRQQMSGVFRSNQLLHEGERVRVQAADGP